jgi:hypothetical protein
MVMILFLKKMEAKKNIKMQFICSRQWESMDITADGRFCSSCNHLVHDLTSKKHEEIIALASGGTKVCGMFRAEQIEPDLVEIELKPLKALRYAAAAMFTFFGLELSTVKAQDGTKTPATHKTDASGNAVDARNSPVCPVGTADMIEREEKNEKPEVVARKKRKAILVTDKASYYWSKRFPFIKKRSRRVLGAMSF